jgi:hypothetical protein
VCHCVAAALARPQHGGSVSGRIGVPGESYGSALAASSAYTHIIYTHT